MATIPIEVIVQDAEAPVVPGEDGTNNTETNITVPDTGTISSSGDTSSSASSIILPAILLVLAIGSIAIILIHKYHKQKKDKTSKKEKLAVATSSTIAILAVTVLIGNLVLPATKAATSDIEDGITPAEDKISITVTRDGGSAEASTESTATITSSSDFGYKVLLSMAEGVETNYLYLNGDVDSEYYIASVEADNEEGVELANNTWGYALTEGGEYNAAPLLDDAVIVAQGDEAVEAAEMGIYYGVKVSSDLPVGTYSGGEIEYGLVALEPTIDALTYMQDFAKLSADVKNSVLNSMREETTYTLKDQRDNQDYTIAKLKDSKVWMTKNLNLAGGTEITSDLSDVPENYILPIDGGFQEGNKLPESAKSFSDGVAHVYNTGNDTDTCSSPGCYSYYSWPAATAGSGLEIDINDTDAPYSICPKGWKLPNSRSTIADNSDFYQLAVAYGMGPDSISGSTTEFQINAGPGTIPNFLSAGIYSGSTLDNWDISERYLSSTVHTSGNSRYFFANSSSVDSSKVDGSGLWSTGFPVRCMIR